jgi:hypothetical protein
VVCARNARAQQRQGLPDLGVPARANELYADLKELPPAPFSVGIRDVLSTPFHAIGNQANARIDAFLARKTA